MLKESHLGVFALRLGGGGTIYDIGWAGGSIGVILVYIRQPPGVNAQIAGPPVGVHRRDKGVGFDMGHFAIGTYAWHTEGVRQGQVCIAQPRYVEIGVVISTGAGLKRKYGRLRSGHNEKCDKCKYRL